MPQQLSKKEIQEIEEAVDEAFMRLYGRTYRDDESPPNDSLEQIQKDFPSLFQT